MTGRPERPKRCPSCGNPPALKTIFPSEPGGHFGTCADKYHDYPWLDEAPLKAPPGHPADRETSGEA